MRRRAPRAPASKPKASKPKASKQGHGLHVAAVDWLALQYPQTVEAVARHGLVWNTINNGTRTWIGQAVKNKRVTLPGEPDLYVYLGGKLLKLELKEGTGTTSPQQRLRHDVLRTAGVYVQVCHDVDEVKASVATIKGVAAIKGGTS